MTKHILGYRTGYKGEFSLYLGADDLQFLVSEGLKAAEFYPDRQFAIFTQRPPRPWWTETRRYVYGLKDAELYKITYGVDQPLPAGIGQMVHNFDHHHTGAT